MNRRKYEKTRRRFYKGKKMIKRLAKKYWNKESPEFRYGYAKMYGKSAFEHYAEDLLWPIHRNYVVIPSWCTYKKNHKSEKDLEKILLKAINNTRR